MISKNDIEIYDVVFQEKKITEKYLGYVNFDWLYSSVQYNADCTLAIPFDLFDKVIVGILLIDEILSIEAIGEILGMNLTLDINQKKYRDEAEYDILRIALDNLKDYGMIEIGDTSYSSCKLTNEGKFFAAKGYKFKLEESKPFKLFFDHTSNKHEEAKKELELLKGKPLPLKVEFDYLDDAMIHKIAEAQVPEIHNQKLGNSFINAKIDYKSSSTFILSIAVALLYDIETNSARLIAYDLGSKKTKKYLTDYLNQQKVEIFSLFNNGLNEGITIDSQKNYLQALLESKEIIQNTFSANPEEAILALKKINQNSEFIDVEYFWSHLKDFVSKNSNEIYLLIPNASEAIISQIRRLCDDNQTTYLFVVFQEPTSEILKNKIIDLYRHSNNIKNKLFIGVYGKVSSFEYLNVTKNNFIKFEEKSIIFSNDEIHRLKTFYKNQKHLNNELPSYVLEIKKTFAIDYLNKIKSTLEDIFEEEINDALLNKQYILDQNTLASKANAFLDTNLDVDSEMCLNDINKAILKHTVRLKDRHKVLLADRLSQLSKGIDETSSEKLEDWVYFENAIKSIQADIFDEYKELVAETDKCQREIHLEIKRIKDEILAKTYIIDTNVFIKDPEIISRIDNKHYVALSLTVIEELDKLKIRLENKENAEKAIRNINVALSNSSKNKKSRIRKARADLTLLPDELQKKTADNLLLSLGLVYKKNNPIFLTLDRNFQSKAMMLDIPCIDPLNDWTEL